MKKFLIILFVFFSFEALSVEKKTTFNIDVFKKAQRTYMLKDKLFDPTKLGPANLTSVPPFEIHSFK